MLKISPWNKGKSVGQKAPFSPRDVQTIKQILANEGNLRDLALFSMGGTHLRRDTAIPQWFQASKATAASDGHAVHC
jgi:hypothetical protein